jgi:hypothetical protein
VYDRSGHPLIGDHDVAPAGEDEQRLLRPVDLAHRGDQLALVVDTQQARGRAAQP